MRPNEQSVLIREWLMRTLLVAAVAALVSETTDADPSWYIGAGMVKAHVTNPLQIDCGGCVGLVPASDFDEVSWKAILGWRPIRPFSVEADYVDFGEKSTTHDHGTTHITGHAAALYANGYLPLPQTSRVELYGKAGVARSELSSDQLSPPITADGTHFAWGLGAQARLARWGVRFDYERYAISQAVSHGFLWNTRGPAEVFSLAATYGF
jgi:hypothetical protein